MCSQCEDISWQLGRDEREAEIIALLEAECDCLPFDECSAHIHIALIKGENK